MVISPYGWGILKKGRFLWFFAASDQIRRPARNQRFLKYKYLDPYNPLIRISQRIFIKDFALCNHKRETITGIIYHCFLLFSVPLFRQPNERKEYSLWIYCNTPRNTSGFVKYFKYSAERKSTGSEGDRVYEVKGKWRR